MQRGSSSAYGSEASSAQAAVYDALLFFVVMILASSLVHVYQTQMIQGQGMNEYAQMQGAASSARYAAMQMTLPNTTYLDSEGKIVALPPMSTRIQDLVLLELSLQIDGLPWDNFAAMEKDIAREIEKLVPGQYEFSLMASTEYGNDGAALFHVYSMHPDKIGNADLCCEEWSCGLPGQGGTEAAFQLLLWR